MTARTGTATVAMVLCCPRQLTALRVSISARTPPRSPGQLCLPEAATADNQGPCYSIRVEADGITSHAKYLDD